MRKPTGSGVEFCLVAQTKCPGSVTTIQERHLDAAMQFFPCSHSLKQPMTFTRLAWNLRLLPARVVNGEAGRQRLGNTHTHNKQRVYCTDAARVTVAKFRLHLNKGICPTPLIGYRTHKSTVCSDIIPARSLWLYVSYMYNIKGHSVTDPTETKSPVRPKCLWSFWSVVKPQFPQLTNSHRHHSF